MAGFEVFSLGDVVLQSGSTLWQARLAYKTYGSLNDARDNVVLIPTFYAAHHSDVEAMFASFAYYFKSGEQHSINSATYLLPPGLPGAVILDATANNDVLYQMLNGRVAPVAR